MTRDDALARARSFAESQGWTWREPANVETYRPWLIGPKRWRVVTNYGLRGGNVRVEIDDASGAVVRGSYLPR